MNLFVPEYGLMYFSPLFCTTELLKRIKNPQPSADYYQSSGRKNIQ
jgi:hypothetical protein